MGYASGSYAWQLTDNAKFTQGVSVFGAEDTTLNSETALNVAINEHFGLKVGYNLTWNSQPPESAPEKNGVKKHAPDIIEYPFFIRYLSARNYWLHDYAYNTMFFGINMNIMLYSFELIFFDGFDVYLLLIFTVIV